MENIRMQLQKPGSDVYDIIGEKSSVVFAKGLFKGKAKRLVACWNTKATTSTISASFDMLDMLKTIENDSCQVPNWLWNKIQDIIKQAERK